MIELQYEYEGEIEIIGEAETFGELEAEFACYLGQDGYELCGDDFRCKFC